jgi:type IV pilus secretin PilQ/predicted competence protein
MRTRFVILVSVCIASAAAWMGPLGASGSRSEVAMLKKIASRVSEHGGVIAIEASDPVAYVASQPDARTFVVELRDVMALGFADNFSADPRHPVSAVKVESAKAADGVNVARVRMTLTQPMRPRVRSARNVIYVEADRLNQAVTTNGAIGTVGQASATREVQVADAFTALKQAPSNAAQASVAPKPASQALPAAAQPAPAAHAAPATTAARAPQKTEVTQSQNLGNGSTRFNGNPVSLDFQGADLRAVLRTFAEISGLNIVIDPTIQGTVDVALRDVPWDQALDIILRANKLGYLVDGTIVRVAPLTVLADEETQRRKLSDEQALAGELRTLTRPLSYARGEDLRPLITATVLSQRGSIQTDPRTNTVIITDLADRLARASELIQTLDRPEPQVEIEARIVQTTREFARTIGVQWGFNGRAAQALGNTLPLSFPNQASVGGRTTGVQGQGADATNSVVDLGVEAARNALGLALGSVNGAVNLDVALSALERQGQGRLLSTPRVSTQNNVEAEITQGVQIPIQTVANNTVTVTFKDAALTLRVTPQITAADTVIMRIAVENAAPDFSRQVGGIPPIDTQRAMTQVLVSNGDTTVIGGIYVSREQSAEDRTPGLHQIPLLGWLFKRENVTDESRELLIFITPRIVRL